MFIIFCISGIGKYIYHASLKLLNSPSILLTADPKVEPTYAAWGYKPSTHRVCSFQGFLKKPDTFNPDPSIKIRPMSEVFDETMAYEKSVSREDRSEIFRMILQSRLLIDAQTAIVDGKVQGFILVLHDNNDAIRLSAFQAKTPEIGTALLAQVAGTSVPNNVNMTVRSTKANIGNMEAIFPPFGLKKDEQEFQGMYHGEDTEVEWEEVYSLLNYAISFI